MSLDAHVRSINGMMMVLKSNGLTGMARMCCNEYTSHQPFQTCAEAGRDKFYVDLRIRTPWPELQAFADTFDLDTMEETQHAKVPFPIILIKMAKKYTAEGGRLGPRDSDGTKFEKFIENNTTYDKNPQSGNFTGFLKEPNWEEASFHEALARAGADDIGSELQEAFDWLDARNQEANPQRGEFWCLLTALRAFFTEHSRYPVTGSIPDFESNTEWYLKMQKLYSEKAQTDAQLFAAHLQTACETAGCVVSEEPAKVFLKNWQCVRAINYRSLSEEHTMPNAHGWQWSEGASKIWYVVWRGHDQFVEIHGRSPVPADFGVLRDLCRNAHKQMGVENFEADAEFDKYVKEMCRYEGGQLPGTCSFLAGIVSVEIIKHLVRQFVPMNNCLVFDGIKSQFESFEV